MRRFRFPLLFLLTLGLAACGSTEEDGPTDVAEEVRDRGGRDTGTGRDTGGVDVSADVGTTDIDPSDAGTNDGGSDDTSTPDASVEDTEPADTGRPDTPPEDTGPADVGAPDIPDGLECSEKAELVYVVTKEKQLHAFDPRDGTFTLVGEVDCGECNGHEHRSSAPG